MPSPLLNKKLIDTAERIQFGVGYAPLTGYYLGFKAENTWAGTIIKYFFKVEDKIKVILSTHDTFLGRALNAVRRGTLVRITPTRKIKVGDCESITLYDFEIDEDHCLRKAHYTNKFIRGYKSL